MTEKDLTELKKLLAAMPLSDLTRAKQLISKELDSRTGKRKFVPNREWDDLFRRDAG